MKVENPGLEFMEQRVSVIRIVMTNKKDGDVEENGATE